MSEHGQTGTDSTTSAPRASDSLPTLGAGRSGIDKEAMALIDRLHAEVEGAEAALDRRFAGPSARQRLDQARQAESEALVALGFDSYADFLFGLPAHRPGEDPFGREASPPAAELVADTVATLGVWAGWTDPEPLNTETRDRVNPDPDPAPDQEILMSFTTDSLTTHTPPADIDEPFPTEALQQARDEAVALQATGESILASMQAQAAAFVTTHVRRVEEEAVRVTDAARAEAGRILAEAEEHRQATSAATAQTRVHLAQEIDGIGATLDSLGRMITDLAGALDGLRQEMQASREALVPTGSQGWAPSPEIDQAEPASPTDTDFEPNVTPWEGDPSGF